MTTTTTDRLPFTGDDAADRLLVSDPLALLIGFALDQQVPLRKAFSGPLELSRRIGGLDARRIATMDPDALDTAFRTPPALHRFPGNMAKRVRELTGGAGVPVVYDSVGKDTFQGSLDCLSPAGLMVSFGNASGAVPPFDIAQLAAKGSLFLTRPTLFSYTARREDLESGARALFQVVEAGKVKVEVGRSYPLAEAAQAHRDLQSRKTTGSLVLLPG